MNLCVYSIEKKNTFWHQPLASSWLDEFFPIGAMQIRKVTEGVLNHHGALKARSTASLTACYKQLVWQGVKFIFSIQAPSTAVSLYC